MIEASNVNRKQTSGEARVSSRVEKIRRDRDKPSARTSPRRLFLTTFSPAKCTDVMLSYCSDMSYAQTVFPNLAGHRTREEAEGGAEYLLLSVVEALLGGTCNPDIRMLGCSVLVPRCEKDAALKPCRSTCEAVRARCSRAFEAIEMNWPYFLDCDRFFVDEQEGCYDPLEGLHGENSEAFISGALAPFM